MTFPGREAFMDTTENTGMVMGIVMVTLTALLGLVLFVAWFLLPLFIIATFATGVHLLIS